MNYLTILLAAALCSTAQAQLSSNELRDARNQLELEDNREYRRARCREAKKELPVNKRRKMTHCQRSSDDYVFSNGSDSSVCFVRISNPLFNNGKLYNFAGCTN